MTQTTNRAEVQREIANLMAMREFRREQAAAYVKSLNPGQLNIMFRHHGCFDISDLIDEITRGLLQGDIVKPKKPNGW